jgi:sugar lactone lactonase YvrE
MHRGRQSSDDVLHTGRKKGRKKMIKVGLALCLVFGCLVLFGGGAAYAQEMPSDETVVVSGLEGGSGSVVGPDGALYVPETLAGRIARIDPETGEVTTFADGLPKGIVGIGGIMDVAFISDTAYALVTLVSEDVGGSDVDGIYELDGPDSFTVVADLGEFSSQHVPTNTAIEVPSGVQYSMVPYGDGFLVTDGHHNRVLQAGLDGSVSELIAFDDIVPTGLALDGDTVYMGEAGPVPHLPEHGKVVSFEVGADTVTDVASGARLIVDVKFSPDGHLYALSQGDWAGNEAGDPAQPDTGSLLKVNDEGSFDVIAEGLNQPTSFEFVGDSVYVVTFGGDVVKVGAQESCTLASIQGTYVLQGHGVTVADGAVLPFAEAGTFTFDGEGGGSGTISVSVNGERVASMQPFMGVYAVASDCIYTITTDDGLVVDVYTTPSADVLTYSSPGISGVAYR